MAGVGLDCIGVPILAARAAGCEVHDFAGYGPLPMPEVLLREIAEDCEQIPTADAKPGDVLCFKSGLTTPTHFGVLVDGCAPNAADRHPTAPLVDVPGNLEG